ncbi:hypothetical protein ASF99_04715 [Exiguobacterium sp. Leaf187]|uniref:hypothetical protein n=1 Tax=Exiguobacterium sp. Leaf187 TaxID=1736294 RepID=UPI000701BD11|nr:hypothetical protein [Exiguobacterium sp. Leaf187]KQS19191.1 hypothetical protein ASF99_04715 [Exiguobacterium sp. Leaf187]
MYYLEYENDTKIVTHIHEKLPSPIKEGHSVAKSDQFEIGMELEFMITVDTVNKEGIVSASSTTKQTVPAYQLLQKIKELQDDNSSLRNQNEALTLTLDNILTDVIPTLLG